MLSPTRNYNFPNAFMIGDDWKLACQYVNDKNIAQDITGFTLRLIIKNDNDVAISGSPFNGTPISATNGTFYFLVNDTITSNLQEGFYCYSIELTDIQLLTITYLKGNLKAEKKC